MIESAADRAALINDDASLALFASITQDTYEGYSYTFPITLGTGPVTTTTLVIERNVVGLFDRAFTDIEGHEAFRPVFLILDEDARYLRQSHRLMLKGHVWGVDSRMPDGHGFTQLSLKLQGAYTLASNDHNGYPYTFPITFGAGSAGDYDDENMPLTYPYTIETHIDTSITTVTL